MNKIFIKNFIENSDLLIEHVFVEYDSTPVVFVCKDIINNLYLCITTSDWKEYECVIFGINFYDLKRVFDRKISLLEAIKLSNDIYKYNINDGKKTIVKISFNIVQNEKLVDSDLFLLCDNYINSKNYIKLVYFRHRMIKALLNNNFQLVVEHNHFHHSERNLSITKNRIIQSKKRYSTIIYNYWTNKEKYNNDSVYGVLNGQEVYVW